MFARTSVRRISEHRDMQQTPQQPFNDCHVTDESDANFVARRNPHQIDRLFPFCDELGICKAVFLSARV